MATIDASSGNDTIAGTTADDVIDAGGGADSVSAGAGNDTIFGDTGPATLATAQGSLTDPVNTDNLSDSGATETASTRAVTFVETADGHLYLVTSERLSATAGISTYRIDNDPSSLTYGQIMDAPGSGTTGPNGNGTADLAGKIASLTATANGDGFSDIQSLAALTLPNGNSFVYSADIARDTIGIAVMGSGGILTEGASLTSAANLDEVQSLSVVTVDGQPILLAYAGGTTDALTSYAIDPDTGALSLLGRANDGSGTGETFLAGDASRGLVSGFTNSAGQTFVIGAGNENGISLWTVGPTGSFTFQNARGNDQNGATETDPQGNTLERDLISPAGSQTGLGGVDAATWAEIGGQTYLFASGDDDDITVFRIDPDSRGDGTFDLTLVGQLDDVTSDISALQTITTADGGVVLVVGGEQAGLKFLDVRVDPVTGIVTFEPDVQTVADAAETGAELADSESIAVAGGLVASASDNDSGVALINSGIEPASSGLGLNPVNSDNIADGGQTETNAIRSVELVTTADGRLFMITSERSSATTGITSYEIDNNPASPTYGQVLNPVGSSLTNPTGSATSDLGGKIDSVTTATDGTGVQDVQDMAAVTLPGGSFLFTADAANDTIAIIRVESDGQLTKAATVTGTGLDVVQSVDVVEVGGQPILLSYSGGTSDRIASWAIDPATGGLTQLASVTDGSGTAENFLQGSDTTHGLVEGYTTADGRTFVVAAGNEQGLSLYTLDSGGQFTFQNARGDDRNGPTETDPQGNTLGRDIFSPSGSQTGLNGVDAAVFGEIDGKLYLFVGGDDDDVTIFRVDPDSRGDGTFDLTLAGQVDDITADISALHFIDTGRGGTLVVGGETGGLRFAEVSVDPVTGIVTLNLNSVETVADGNDPGAELMDSEAIAAAGGILVSASDNDNGVAILTTSVSSLGIGGADGNDTIDSGAGNDVVYGGGGADSIVGGDGDDTLDGGTEADTLDGGAGNDWLTGGAGADVFVVDGADVLTDFDATTGIQGTAGAPTGDNDFVDLSGFYNDQTLAAWNAANPASTYSNPLAWMKADFADDGTLQSAGRLRIEGAGLTANSFSAENTAIACFTRGTRIRTATGEVAVQHLVPGDLVLTLDHGFQPLRWIGATTVPATGRFAPIRFAAGAIGNRRALRVSPQHRMMLTGWQADLLFDAPEVLVAARLLVNDRTIRRHEGGTVDYFHLLFDAHEIIYAEGIPSESFHPGQQTWAGLGEETRAEILALFPELAKGGLAAYGPCARRCLTAREASVAAHLLLAGQTAAFLATG
ncbi:Hint domain-containing protein [Rhodobacter amnigenus]|nr:Hint domain-containing protein [Rhodobacter amnigenus]